MKEITIEITTYCPNTCSYCSTNAGPNGKHMSFEKIEEIIEDCLEGVDRINISGGEPLAHPDFWKILQLCKEKTSDIWVYTNALTQIKYNAQIVKELTCEANVCLIPGEAAYIPKNASKVHLLKMIRHGRAKNLKSASISISGNLTGREECQKCNHIVYQADGQVISSPCRKNYNITGKV